MNKRFEYKVISRTSLKNVEKMLNTHGNEGWELVGYSSDAVYLTSLHRSYSFILKREIK